MSRTQKLGLIALLVLTLSTGPAHAIWRKDSNALDLVNFKIKGRVIDHTANHGHDNRMWSKSLGQKRDLYVYLPPGYNKCESYPIMLFLHGFASDEQSFLAMVPEIDKAIRAKHLPPLIIAVPDGSIHGEPCFYEPGSFFLNTEAGYFEDFLLNDVWDLLCRNYSIRPEREAHILAGSSMGGGSAFNLGIRYRENFGVVIGILPPLNLRWMDGCGGYFGDFDPREYGWRTDLNNPGEVIARFGVLKLRIGDFVAPLYGMGPDAVAAVSQNNPIELVDRCHLRDGELAMYVGYGGKDEFNLDAHAESFLYLCKCRGITVHVGLDPEGRHNAATALRLMPGAIRWLNEQLTRCVSDGCRQLCDAACK